MKILLLILVLAVAVPVFATCSIDMEKPCTAENSLDVRIDPDPVEQMKKSTNSISQDKSFETQTQTYNSNCQFGICLPDKTPNDTNLQN